MYKLNIIIAISFGLFLITEMAYLDEPIEYSVLLKNHIFKNNEINDIKVFEYQITNNIRYKEARIYFSLHSTDSSKFSLMDPYKINKFLRIVSFDRKTIVLESNFPLIGGICFPIIDGGVIVEIWSKGLSEGIWTTDVGIIYYKDSLFSNSISSRELLLFQERFFSL